MDESRGEPFNGLHATPQRHIMLPPALTIKQEISPIQGGHSWGFWVTGHSRVS